MSNTIFAAFTACNVVFTDKADNAATNWADATVRGDIMDQSFYQLRLESLIGTDRAIAVLTKIGASL